MDIKTKPDSVDESIAPFGGIHPKVELPNNEMMGSPTPSPLPSLDKLSLVDDQPVNENALSLIDKDETVAKVTGSAATNRIDRYSFALGKDFSKEDIDFAVKGGNEEWLRQAAADKRDAQEQEVKAGIIRDELSKGLPSDANEQSILFANVKTLNDYTPKNNPKTVVEKAYAEEYVRKVPETGPDGGVTQKLINNIADKQVDKDSEERIRSATDTLLTTEEIGKRGIMWQEIAKKHAEDQAETVKGEGWSEWLYEGTKKNIVPFYDWYHTYNAIPAIKTEGFLQGDSLASQVSQLHKLTPEQLDKTLEDLRSSPWAKDHPHEAERFLEAVVSYGGTDQFIDNLVSGADLILGASRVGKGAAFAEKQLAARGARKEFETAVARTTSYQPKFGPDGKKIELPQPSLAEQTVVSMADHVKANADPTATMGERLAQVGDIKASSVANAVQNAEGLLTKGQSTSTPLTLRQMASNLPSFVNPMNWAFPGIGSSAARSANLQTHIQLNGQKVLDNIKDLLTVNRLPEEALQMAFKMEDDEFSKTLNFNINNAVQNISRQTIGPVAPVNNPIKAAENIRPESNLENIGRVDFTLTKPDGTAFNGPTEVQYWAERMYGLHEGDYGARQVGNGFEMTVSRALDETRPEVRDLLITTNNKTPFSLVAFLKSGGARVSEFNANNRLAYLSGQQGLIEAMKDLASDLRLGSKDWTKVNRVMQEDMQRANPFDPQNRPGKFLDNVQDFGAAYRRLNGHAPSDREINAYFTAVKVNEIEHQLRNASQLKELSRLGLKEVTLKTKTVDPKGFNVFGETNEFKGKVINDLPTGKGNSKADAVVVIYDEGTDPVYRPLSIFAGGDGKKQLKDLQAQGYKIIQTANPVRSPGEEIFKDGPPVNFIITKDHTVKELNPSQLPYREGWHQSYDYDYFVKQAGVRKVENHEFVNGAYVKNGSFSHVFEGDITHSGYRTEGEARKFAKAMDDARKLAFHTPGATAAQLDQFLSANLPYNSKQFISLFTPDPKTGKSVFEKENPFLHVASGETTSDTHWGSLSSSFNDLVDAIRTPWNLVNQVDKKFVGARDELLNTIREEGTQANPIFKLQKAETIDPYSAMSQAMTNIMRNRFMIDYRIQSVESYIKEFGHLYGDIPEQDLYSNAMDYLYQAVPIAAYKNPDLRMSALAAESSRRAIIELMGHEAIEGHILEATKALMIEMTYKNAGQKASDVVATSQLRKIKDPFKFLKSLAFHEAIGVLNPFQAYQNLQTLSQIAAISPVHGTKAFIPAFLNYAAMRFNNRPEIINHLANISHEIGFSKHQFKEWHNEFKMSGRFSMEGEHAWQGDMEGPALHRSMLGNILDKGLILFKESDRMVRTVAHATAYLEWRSANPTAPITGQIRAEILNRSDTMAGNMTRAHYAAWQNGFIKSNLTQFWSYQARLTELMLSPKGGRVDRLSWDEKARIIMTNTILYGAPAGGAGTVVGGFFSPYDDIKAAAIKHGIELKEGSLEAFEKGVSGVVAHMLTGRASDINEAIAPKGRSIIDTMTDKSMLEFMFGAGGQKAIGAWRAASPLVYDLMMAIKGENYPIKPRDFLPILNEIGSISQVSKLWIYFNNKDRMAYTKNDLKIGEIDNEVEAAIWAFTGALPSELGEDKVIKILLKERENTLKEIDEQLNREALVIEKAREAKDADTLKAALTRYSILASGRTFQEAKKLFAHTVSSNKTLHDKLDRQWYLSTMNPENQQ